MVSTRLSGRCALAGILDCLLLSAAIAFAEEPDEDLTVKPGDSAKLAFVQARAEAGAPRAQTRLADYHLAAADLTNAAAWYRRAAEQGDVEAQLALASLFLAGQGVAKDPQEAAQWLRAAASRIDGSHTNTKAVAAALKPITPAPPCVAAVAKAGSAPTLTNAPASLPPTNRPPPARVQRVLAVQAVAPLALEPCPAPQLQRATP